MHKCLVVIELGQHLVIIYLDLVIDRLGLVVAALHQQLVDPVLVKQVVRVQVGERVVQAGRVQAQVVVELLQLLVDGQLAEELGRGVVAGVEAQIGRERRLLGTSEHLLGLVRVVGHQHDEVLASVLFHNELAAVRDAVLLEQVRGGHDVRVFLRLLVELDLLRAVVVVVMVVVAGFKYGTSLLKELSCSSVSRSFWEGFCTSREAGAIK
ncbi:hypothetical protein BpHYR1_029594 [Brachionus plicatilis]|uniref:Uncharacterized protein n=1 Tax=Brachionus plicatilis TaxID=10195 RepID=A0A3M7SKG7_BRAPC|nr:hypothetical protein BpHYR1_029594 [Brachionus plicatilis]